MFTIPATLLLGTKFFETLRIPVCRVIGYVTFK